MLHRLCLSLLFMLTVGVVSPSMAGSKDKAFFESVSGEWRGPGEIVAGKYKGTKFVCKLKGDQAAQIAVGIALDGHCRVGIFSQKMSAFINGKGRSYSGRFLDGAKGEGLDITSAKVHGNKIVVDINRKKLNGAMVAHLKAPDTMDVTISVKVSDRLIPVIGMTLQRSRRIGSK